jgi:acetoin utilization deacetylase AcuC-like enzyme
MRFLRKKNNAVKVVYSHDYFFGLDGPPLFDIMRFKKIRDKLIDVKLLHRKDVLIPEMVAYDDLQLVHAPDYLNAIRDPLQVAQILRLDHLDPFDTHVLEYFRIVTGGTLLATEYALKYGAAVFNLGGGFHHAHRDKGGGFCLVNDIAVAREKYCRNLRCLIIDLDYHQGDGNLAIFNTDHQVFTFSMHAGLWIDSPKKENLDILLPDKCSGQKYIALLQEHLPALFTAFNPEFVFYVAGSDPYIYDALGDLSLSRDDMLIRNMFVLNSIKERQLPAVILAGGGYGERSWEVYYDFIYHSLSRF